MAVYKVPQDVEADDKLIGPFSFRQFVYLIIVVMAGALAWGLGQLFIGLAIIPLPVILLFGALALPLRKDQPMEIYLAAIISYYIKPRKRLWDPDGIDSLIEITVPKTVEVHRTKDITQADAEQRFSYLASLVDSQGWSIRGAEGPLSGGSPLNQDTFLEAQSAQDILDTNNSVAQSFNTMMAQRTEALKQEAREHMFNPQPTPQAPVMPAPATPSQFATPVYNPYPTDIQQTMIQPIGDPAHVYQAPTQASAPAPQPVAPQTVEAIAQPIEQPPAPSTSDKPLSADIMNLANNTDLSIETIAREAHRIQEKEADMSEEVVISLR